MVLAAGSKLKILDSGTPVQGHAISKPEAEIESSSEPEGAHSLWIAKNAQTTVPMVDIHTISVDLASFSSSQQEGTVEAPQVIVPGGSYVRSGELNLELVNTTGTGYENHALLKNEAKVPLMSFVASSDEASAEISNLSVSDLQIHVATPEIEEDTYGHMGDWSEAKIQDGTLVINWNPTGYRLDPQKAGALVFNALWEEGAVLSALKMHALLIISLLSVWNSIILQMCGDSPLVVSELYLQRIWLLLMDTKELMVVLLLESIFN